jgi:hypothetical protein
MLNEKDRQLLLCRKLQRLGYSAQQRIRLYGEEFDLVSDPIPEDNGFAVDGISRKSGNVRRVPIPLSIVHVAEHELYICERQATAA